MISCSGVDSGDSLISESVSSQSQRSMPNYRERWSPPEEDRHTRNRRWKSGAWHQEKYCAQAANKAPIFPQKTAECHPLILSEARQSCYPPNHTFNKCTFLYIISYNALFVTNFCNISFIKYARIRRNNGLFFKFCRV